MRPNSLDGDVLKTIAYFHLFHFPLTATELWKYLWRRNGPGVTYKKILTLLTEEKTLKKYLSNNGTFFYLKNTVETIPTREKNYRASIKKINRARKVSYWFSWLPWIEGIAICNSLGYQNARPESDIDLFIVTRPNTLWLTRFLTTIFLKIFKLRPTSTSIANTICLSFFITRDNMNLKNIALPDGDPYLIYWITQLTPLFEKTEVWREFWQINGPWVKEYLPNAIGYSGQVNSTHQPKHKKHPPFILTRYVDKILENIQKRRFPQKIKNLITANNTNVVLSSYMLKFHTNDRRLKYKKEWLNLRQNLNLPN